MAKKCEKATLFDDPVRFNKNSIRHPDIGLVFRFAVMPVFIHMRCVLQVHFMQEYTNNIFLQVIRRQSIEQTLGYPTSATFYPWTGSLWLWSSN